MRNLILVQQAVNMPADSVAMWCGRVVPKAMGKAMGSSTWGMDFRPWVVQGEVLDLRLLPELGLLKLR